MDNSHLKTPVLIYYIQLCDNMCGSYIFGSTDGGHIGFFAVLALSVKIFFGSATFLNA